jgi:hypothetical protein
MSGRGKYRWTRRFGRPYGSAETFDGVAVDTVGNEIVAGHSAAGIDLGSGRMTGFYVGKLTPDGHLAWSTAFAESHHAGEVPQATSVLAVDPRGDIVIGGQYRDAIDFGAAALDTPWGAGSAFLAKLWTRAEVRAPA